jgi:hypothetical protein
MLLADDLMPVSPEKLATAGTPYVLAVCLGLVVFALYRVFTLWQADRERMQSAFAAALDGQRKEFTAALKEVSVAVQAVAAEAKANAAATAQLAAESKANTAAILSRLDRLEAQRAGESR